MGVSAIRFRAVDLPNGLRTTPAHQRSSTPPDGALRGALRGAPRGLGIDPPVFN